MRIAYNPKTAAALTTAPANNDITFDLSGLSIYVRGERFKGTDTTYSVFKKHDSSGGGYDGLVPVPSYNNNSKNRYLREDGTWLYVATTDLSVLLSETTTTSYRPIVLGLTYDTNVSNLSKSVTGLVYVTTKMYALPSTGYLYASKLFSGGKEVLTEHQSLANYVTLDTNLVITGVKTFSTLLKFTVGLGTAPFTVTSTTNVANLNADLLDGWHSSSFVGGNKTAKHGSRGTEYTADTYSLKFVEKSFAAFAERGSWAYADNGYITTDTGVNIPLAGTAIFLWGASDTYKTLLFITPHDNSGVNTPAADEMLFYTSNGSGYTSAWTRVITNRNYKSYLGNDYWKVNQLTTKGTGDIYLEMWRGTNASWKMLNSGGNLYFQSNYTSSVGNYFNVLTLNYNSGNASLMGLFNAGREVSNKDKRFNYGLAYYNTTTSSVTGTIVITLPNGWNNSMNTYEIDIYEYIGYLEDADNRLHSKLIIDGYNYSDERWVNYGYTLIGSYNKGVRLGYNGSKCVIMLGTTSSTWSYPLVHLSRVITGYSNLTLWSSGYSISVITSESGYSKIVTVNRLRLRFSDVVANNFRGTATKAKYLDGFASGGTASQSWGNQIGTGIHYENDSTGGSFEFRRDNPSSGKVSFKVDGRVYVSEGNYPVIASVFDSNNFPALLTPDGTSNWIRVSNSSSYGLLPNQSGSAGSGHGYLGTSSWYFKYAYIDLIYGHLNGDISGNAPTSTKASYARNLLGRNTSGSDYSAVDGNLIFAEWDTYTDSRWYLKAKGYECRVGYSNNSDKVDGEHLSRWYKHGYAYPYGKSSKPWHKVASFSLSTSSGLINTSISFYVSEFYNSKSYGIINIRARGELGSTSLSWATADWSLNTGIDVNDFVLGVSSSGTSFIISLYIRRSGWSSYAIRKIEEQAWGSPLDSWVTYIAYNENANCFASIPDTSTYTSTNLALRGTIDNATNATNIYVNQHTSNNIEYPLVWSNLANTNSALSNLLYKSYSHLTYNPYLRRIIAGLFYANNAGGPHFTGISTSGNWAYIRLNNSTCYWDIATKNNSGSGGLWLARYNGGDNGIFVSTGSNVGIGTSSPTQKLHVAGDAIATNFGVTSTSGTGLGISLYGGSGYVSTYGLAFVQTSNWGTHGYVTADWATYFTMNNLNSRGWIFRRTGSGNVFSIDTSGLIYANGRINGNYYISRVATGTQPYACTSTTVNTNLNADLLDGLHESSFYRHRGSYGKSYTAASTDYNLGPGTYITSESGYSGTLLSFNSTGSTSAIQFWSHYSQGNLYYRTSVDSNRWGKTNGAWTRILDSDNYTSYVNPKATSKTIWGLTYIDANSNFLNVNGLLYVTASGNTTTIGSQNGGWCHIYNSANIPFIFNKAVYTIGNVYPYDNNTHQLGGNSNKWKHLYLSNRAYLDEWIQFSSATGLYWPNTNTAHLYANAKTSYGGLITHGSRGGYCGLHCGPDNTYMTVMSHVDNLGLYNESKSRWFVYYNRPNDRISIYNSNVDLGYGVLINQRTGIKINSYPSLHLVRTDAGETSMYFSNNTAGWAIGVNPWGVGAGLFAIGLYSGTGSSYWRFRIDNNGYCYTRSYLNLGAGNEKNASNPPYVWGVNGSDNYLRTYATSSLSVGYASNSDKLDGLHLDEVSTYTWHDRRALDLRSYDSNKWYPCWIKGSPSYSRQRISIRNALNGNKPSWASHSSGFSLIAEIWWVPSGWGTLFGLMGLEHYQAGFGGETAFGGVLQNTMASTLIIWLRGGGYYYYWTSSRETSLSSSTGGYSWALGTDSYSVSPRTSLGSPYSGFNYYTLAYTSQFSSLFSEFSGGGISSSGNTITLANHSITVGGTTRTAGSSSCNIINSLSVSNLSSSSSTNLTTAVTVNGVTSANKTLTNLWATWLNVEYCRGDGSPSNKGAWSTIKNGTSNAITGRVRFYTIYKDGGPSTYGELLEICSANTNHWQPLLWFGAEKDGRLYYRNKTYNDNSWGSWRTVAWTSEIPTVTNYYWANILVSATSNTATTPTFSKVTISYSSYPGLQITRSGSTYGAIIGFSNSNGVLGGIGMSGTANGGLLRWTANYSTSYIICDTENTSFTRYLTSGTKIGTLKIGGSSVDLYCLTNTNTDTLVNLSETTTSNYRPVVLGYTNSSSVSLTANVTNVVYVSNKFYAKPSTGELFATKFVGIATKADTIYALNNNTAYCLLGASAGNTYTTALRLTATIGGAAKPIYISEGKPTACSSTVGSGIKPVYMSSGTITASGSSVGSSKKPVYLSSGTITLSDYSFYGSSTQPIVLVAGYIYRNSATDASDNWIFSGYKHEAVGDMSGTASISGGVAQFSFGSVSGKSFYFKGVVANHRTSKKMSSATSGNSDNVRSDGLWWFGTHTSNTSIYIRACCNGDKNNDSTLSQPGAWKTWEGAILSFSIIVIGYAT